MPNTDAALDPLPTADGNVIVCAVLDTVTLTITVPANPAEGKFENAKLILPLVVTV